MSNIIAVPSISQESSDLITFYKKQYGDLEVPTNCKIVTAAFLIIGALIVTGSACLCLTLPGVNVMNDVVLKAVIPSSGALILSIPLIVGSVLDRRVMNEIRAKLVSKLLEEIKAYNVIDLPKNDDQNQQVDFLLLNVLQWEKKDPNNWKSAWKKKTITKEKQGKLIMELKKKIESEFPDKKSDKQTAFLASFDEAHAKIYAKDKNKN